MKKKEEEFFATFEEHPDYPDRYRIEIDKFWFWFAVIILWWL